jgi:hypothetical protein
MVPLIQHPRGHFVWLDVLLLLRSRQKLRTTIPLTTNPVLPLLLSTTHIPPPHHFPNHTLLIRCRPQSHTPPRRLQTSGHLLPACPQTSSSQSSYIERICSTRHCPTQWTTHCTAPCRQKGCHILERTSTWDPQGCRLWGTKVTDHRVRPSAANWEYIAPRQLSRRRNTSRWRNCYSVAQVLAAFRTFSLLSVGIWSLHERRMSPDPHLT